MQNAAAFFDAVRASLFNGRLTAAQVEGMNVILREWQESGSGNDKQLAYVLATTFHETAHTMQPVHERGQRSYFDKYEPGTRIGNNLGNTVKGDGFRYRGRGFVQITGRANYVRMGGRLGIDMEGNPELALDPYVAAEILIIGMIEGLFTGKALSDYIGATRCDYVNARRIVNGTDRAQLIAGYARKFEEALSDAGGLTDGRYTPPPSTDAPDRKAPSKGLLGGLSASGAVIATWLASTGSTLLAVVVVAGVIGVAAWFVVRRREEIIHWWRNRRG